MMTEDAIAAAGDVACSEDAGTALSLVSPVVWKPPNNEQ